MRARTDDVGLAAASAAGGSLSPMMSPSLGMLDRIDISYIDIAGEIHDSVRDRFLPPGSGGAAEPTKVVESCQHRGGIRTSCVSGRSAGVAEAKEPEQEHEPEPEPEWSPTVGVKRIVTRVGFDQAA